MAYLGGYGLGATVPIYLQCTNFAGQASLPTAPPRYEVKAAGSSTIIESGLMPIEDRYKVTGLFTKKLFLGRLYTQTPPWYYTITYFYVVGSYHAIATDNFKLIPGGDNKGAVISTYFYERPEANYVLQSMENGSIIKGRNPTV